MNPHTRKLTLFAYSLALALVCAAARVHVQTSGPRRVTATPENAASLNPSLSGDGQRVVFESTAPLAAQTGPPQFRAFAADLSADPSTFAQLAASRAPAPALSRDGSVVAFSSAEDLTGENADRNPEIFLSDNGRLAQFTHTSPADAASRTRDGNFRPSISDDARLVAFASNRDLSGANADANSEIFLYDTNTRRFTQLTNADANANARDAKLSGDGSRVAFIRETATSDPAHPRIDLALCEVVSRACANVAENVAQLSLTPARAISDDGARVVFSAQTAASTAQVFLYDARNGGVLRQLTHLNSRVTDVPLNPTISGDGSRATFATRRNVVGGNSDASVELYLYDIPSNQTTRITDAPGTATAEVVSSLDDEGARVAFNFPRVLTGPVAEEEFANNSEIFLAVLAPRAPFSNDLRLRHGATPDLTLAQGRPLAAGQIAVARGANLALDSAQTARLASGSSPLSFRNTSVTVNGRPAPLLYVSPTQINFQIPDATERGTAQIVVRNHDGYESHASVEIAQAAPGLFTERGDGAGAALALDSATLLAAPFDPHDATGAPRRVTLFATGVRHAANVSATLGGRVAAIDSISASLDLPGLDEIHILLPRSLAGAGPVQLTLNADGRASNAATLQLLGTRTTSRVVLAPTSALLGVGRSLTFTATAFDEDGFEIEGASCDFTSADSNVASIDEAGRAFALREGETRIRAACGEASAEAQLTVRPLTLAINEALVDPPEGPAGDANRDGTRSAAQDEFVEIVNASDADIDLGGYKILTRATTNADTTRHVFAPGTILAPGTAVVVFGGASAATFNPRDPAFGGALVATASTGSLSLVNGGGTITLLDTAGASLEEFSYGGATTLEGDRDQSLTRAPDVLGDFALHAAVADAANRPYSPGTRTDGSPFVTAAPVARVEVEPASAELRPGESQRFNARAFAQDGRELSGVIFRWRSSDQATATVDQQGNARALKIGSVEINAEGRGTMSAPARLSVVPPPPRVVRVEIVSPPASLNRGASAQLSARAFDRAGLVVADAIFTWRSDDSAILTVDPSGLVRAAGLGAAHITATTDDGAGGVVSATVEIDARVPVAFGEILADVPPDNPATLAVEGDANRDGVRDSGDDEFVELFNPSDAPVDLSGVKLSDATSDRFTFPAGTTLEARRALVVFGGANAATFDPRDPSFGGAQIFKASSLGLNDGGDALTLRLKVGTRDLTVAAQTYGTQGGPVAPSDQSLTRERADSAGALGEQFVAHASATDSAARAFSPGTYPDGTPFGSPRVTRVEIDPASAVLDTGATQLFNARAFVQTDGVERALPNVSFAWDASAPALISVTHASGISTTARAASAGTATVRARAGGLEALARVIINPPPPILARLEIAPQAATINVGESRQFVARAFDQYGQFYARAAISFASSDPALASVDSVVTDAGDASATAIVSGRAAGSPVLTATAVDADGASKSAQAALLIVVPPPFIKRISVSPAGAAVNRGQSQQFTAQAFGENDLPVAGVTFVWTGTDAKVATVNAAGLARGVGIGTCGVVASVPDGRGGTTVGRATMDVRAPLVVNEILADVPPDNANTPAVEGDANRDGARGSGDDEFVELLNNSDAPLDISGVVVADSTANRFSFPANTTLAAGQAVIVFGGGNPPARDPAFGGALVFAAGSLGLNDGGDTVTIKLPVDGGEIVIASQSFGSAAASGPAAPSDQSLTRAPDAGVGMAGGGFVAHTSAPNADARAFSPGTRADGTPFGSPPLARIEIAPLSASLDIGARQSFAARAFAQSSGGEVEVASVSFAWDAVDASKATLAPTSGAGTNVTASAAGATTVRARAGGMQATASLTVNPPPPVLTRITVSPASATVATGETQQFTARGFDQTGQEMSGLSFAWASSDERVATVDATGLATARAEGTTGITAASDSVTSAPAPLQIVSPHVATAGQVVVNEALVSFATSTTQARADFVELHNTTAQTLDISGLVVSFRASGNTTAVSTATLPGAVGSQTTLIQPRGYFLIASGPTTFGVAADFNAAASGFNLNDTTGAIKIELGNVKLDGLSYQGGTTAPPAAFNGFGEGTLLLFTGGTTNDLIRSPNAADTNNNATDFRRNGATASVTPKGPNP